MKYKTAFYSFYLPVAAAMYMVSLVGRTQEGPSPSCKAVQEGTSWKALSLVLEGFIPVISSLPSGGY